MPCKHKQTTKQTKRNTLQQSLSKGIVAKRNGPTLKKKNGICLCYKSNYYPIHIKILSRYCSFYLDRDANTLHGENNQAKTREGHLVAFKIYASLLEIVKQGKKEKARFIADKMMIALSPLIALVVASKLTQKKQLRVSTNADLQDLFFRLLACAGINNQKRSIEDIKRIFIAKERVLLNCIEHQCTTATPQSLNVVISFLEDNIKCTINKPVCFFNGLLENAKTLKADIQHNQVGFF